MPRGPFGPLGEWCPLLRGGKADTSYESAVYNSIIYYNVRKFQYLQNINKINNLQYQI